MTRPPCSGCGSIPPAAARFCPTCARPLPPEPSAAVEAARTAADLRRQRDRTNADELLRAYDPKAARPDVAAAPETAPAGSLPSHLAAAAGSAMTAAAGAAAHGARMDATLAETVSPGPNPASAQLWRPLIRMEQQLFPSWIVSTAVTQPGNFARGEANARGAVFVGDPDGLIGVHMVSPRPGAGVRVTVDVGGIARSSVFECSLPQAGATYAIFPKVKYDYEALLQTRQQKPADVTVRVDVDGAAAGEVIETCTLRSINDCPFLLDLVTPSQRYRQDIGFMFAAYVNENHPWIESLLKEALHRGIIGHFFASPGMPPDSIVAQVYAVWSVLRRRGVKYSNITTTTGREGGVWSQHVRFVDDSVTNAQANCADGSVLLASVLRKIGVEPYLVYVPNHMYLAFSIAEAETPVGKGTARAINLFGLETTMIGSPNAAPSPEWADGPRSCTVMKPLPWLGMEGDGTTPFEFTLAGAEVSEARVARSATLDPDDWRNFLAALQHGTKDLASGYVDAEGRPRDIQILRVSDARQAGLMPLAYRPATGATPPDRPPSHAPGDSRGQTP